MPKLFKKPKFLIQDFEAGRVKKECYKLYFTRFPPCLEKKMVWNRKLKNVKEDKDLLTISCEAFGQLMMENQ